MMGDDLSAFARLLTSSLGAGHPIRLLSGVSLALIAKIAVAILAKYFPDSPIWTTLNEYAAWCYILIVTPLLFVPLVMGRKGALEAPIQQINTVKLLIQEGDFSASERRQIWRSLADRYIKGVQPSLARAPSLAELSKEAIGDARRGQSG
ncbi:hypothetical protein [Bradyrhizobium centrosematis]|uniref:hypothetical protein n=1 Tax=Bradyrhizobium centrosematis TaxID=1300039 RepID=UPI0038907578